MFCALAAVPEEQKMSKRERTSEREKMKKNKNQESSGERVSGLEKMSKQPATLNCSAVFVAERK